MKATRLLILVITAAMISNLIGCAKPAMQRLTDEKFKKKSKHSLIDMYIGGYPGNNQPIAVINSNSLPEKDAIAKATQIENLRKRARKLGADAVHNIRLLPREVKGFIGDPNTPFRSWKQGTHYVYFLRGTAIKYEGKILDVEEEQDDPFDFKPPEDEDEAAEDKTEIENEKTEEEKLIENIPEVKEPEE